MDAAEHVWWHVMEGRYSILVKMLELTEEIYKYAKGIQAKMEDNQENQVEALSAMFERREQLIRQLNEYVQQANFQWAEEDRHVISKLRGFEQLLRPLLNTLHESFATQMNKVSQTKQLSKKYMNTYPIVVATGSFIDKRK